MMHIYKILLLIVALSLTGCDSPSTPSNVASGAAGGAVIGGVGGTAIGSALGYAGKGALIGGGAGLIGGAIVGAGIHAMSNPKTADRNIEESKYYKDKNRYVYYKYNKHTKY